jgi:DNA-directed RNA polymerase specialized sigma24 family protein
MNHVADPHEQADETIFRVVQALARETDVQNLPAFCHTVARHVLSEHRRRKEGHRSERDRYAPQPSRTDREHVFRCLERCRQELSSAERGLIDTYYQGEKGERIANRKRLAETLEIAPAALRLRALRLRQKLLACLEKCGGIEAGGPRQ